MHSEAVVQDMGGFMWMAAYGTGLIRYDGFRYRVFNQTQESSPRLTDNHVKDILTDQAGRLWIGHLSGIDILHPKSLKILFRISLKQNPNDTPGFVHRFIKDESGDIWAAVYNKGIVKFKNGDPQKMEWVQSIMEVISINRTPDGTMYCISNFGFYRYQNNKFESCFPQLPYMPVNMPVIKPIEDSTGKLVGYWLVRLTGEVTPFRYNSAIQGFEPGMPPSGITVLSHPAFQKAMLMSENNYYKHALYRHGIRCYTDRQNVIWVAMQYGGYFKMKLKEVKFNTCPDLEGVSLRGMIEARDGTIFLGTYNGLFHFNPSTNRAKLISDRPQIVAFQPACIMGDTLLSFSETQAVVYQSLRRPWVYQKASGLTQDNLNTIYAGLELDSSFFLAGNRNLFLINAKNLEIIPFQTLPCSPETKTFAFKHAINGGIWVGTSQGVFRLNRSGKIDTPEWLRQIPQLGTESRINDIFEENNGTLWFATHHNGLVKVLPQDQSIKVWGKNEGLPSNETYKITSTDSGNTIWVSTSAGLCALETQNEQWHIFSEIDGTAGSEFNTGSFLKARNGTLYWGGVRGLTYFHPETFKPAETIAPEPYISEINIEDIYSSVIHKCNQPPKDTVFQLRSSQNTLEFFLGTTDYFRPESNSFLIKLDPTDAEWIPLGDLRSIKYYRLPAGEYTLQIRYSNHNSSIYKISFRIDEVLYQKGWFQILAGLVVLATLAGLWGLRQSRIRREEQIRKAIANDLHNTLGGKISTLGHMIHVMELRQKDGKNIQNEFQRVSELIKKAQETLSDVIWVLSRKSSVETDLINRMHDYADRWLLSTHIQVKFEKELEPGASPIPLSIQHECLLLYKELLGNILKHTYTENVHILVVNRLDSGLTIEVKNYFKNRKEDVPKGGVGLQMVKEHILKLGGKVEITSELNSFTVKINIPRPFKNRWK
ncbi:MAG TPA: triple tyrosine motif-containing protein [Saprospiraceae bacterium]|nr:triple tyrosine motif-containing protein [Saprospiraceae bacterium]